MIRGRPATFTAALGMLCIIAATYQPPEAGAAEPAQATRTPAAVTGVHDGDTIHVDVAGTDYSVRYIGIDCPELGAIYGEEAKAANAAFVDGQTVLLERDVSETDRYGRLLRYVFLQDGTFVNAKLVVMGYCFASEYPPDTGQSERLAKAQRQAIDEGMGWWGLPKAYMPALADITYCIDLNTASAEELDRLIDIGPVLAQRIIDERPYERVDDLKRVNRIGPDTVKDIKRQRLACVDGRL